MDLILDFLTLLNTICPLTGCDPQELFSGVEHLLIVDEHIYFRLLHFVHVIIYMLVYEIVALRQALTDDVFGQIIGCDVVRFYLYLLVLDLFISPFSDSLPNVIYWRHFYRLNTFSRFMSQMLLCSYRVFLVFQNFLGVIVWNSVRLILDHIISLLELLRLPDHTIGGELLLVLFLQQHFSD